jgi:hypothetical protein
MNSFKSEGGLQYRFRTLTPAEYAAEVAGDSEDVIGLTADQADLRNLATGEPSKATSSTADLLAEAFKRVAKGQTVKRKVEVSERRVNEPEPKTSHTPSETSEALAAVIKKLRS